MAQRRADVRFLAFAAALLLCLGQARGVGAGSPSALGRRLAQQVAACSVGDAACFCKSKGAAGTYIEPTGCLGWYQCTSASAGIYFPCGPGTLYDQSCNCCNWPSQVQCSAGPKPGAPASPPPAPRGLCKHKVKVGTTIVKLAKLYKTTATRLRKLNPTVNWGALKPGRLLTVPCLPAPAPSPSPPPSPGPSPGNDCKYTIKSGDTFFVIAQARGTTVAAIQAANPGVDPTKLQVGQVINLPCSGGTSPVPSPPPSPDNPVPGAGIERYISAAQYADIFKHSGDAVCSPGFYTYTAFIEAARAFPAFAASADDATNRRELAAFLAQISQETTGGWPTAPDGPYAWGLCFKEEGGNGARPTSNYCSPSAQWPCAPGKTYWGRGPMQLSWNYNYGQAGQALGVDLLARPEVVASDATLAFKTALWFWMTPQSPKPSCHDVMAGSYSLTPADVAAGRTLGFGLTTNIINGGIECGAQNAAKPGIQAKVLGRVGHFQRYAGLLGVDTGPNLDCFTQGYW